MRRYLLLRINSLSILCILNLACYLSLIQSSKIGSQNLHISEIQFSRTSMNPFPATRSNSAMTVTEKGEFFMFGGVTSKGVYSSDFYRFDAKGWTKILESKHSPGSREMSNLFTDNDEKLYMIGGKKFSNSIMEILVFIDWKNEWEKLIFNYSSFPSLIDHTIYFDKINLIFYLVGGYEDGKPNSDVFEVSLKDLTIKRIETVGAQPYPTSNPIVHLFNKKLYVFGGYKHNGEYNQEMFVLDLNIKNEWKNSNLVFNDEKSKQGFKVKLVDIKGVGDQDKIYIYNPAISSMFKIQISDYSSIEFLQVITDVPASIYGYNFSFFNQKFYFYGGFNEKEYLNTIRAVTVNLFKPATSLHAVENTNNSEPKALVPEQNLKKIQQKITTNPANIIYTVTTNCPSSCSGNGECLNSKCFCIKNFTGEDCSVSTSPSIFHKLLNEYLNYILAAAAASVIALSLICYFKNKSQKLIL